MSPTHGIGPDEFRRHAHEVVDWIAEYLGHPEGWPVLPVLDWLRQMLGLSEGFVGSITDTASSSTLYALAAARENLPELELRTRGMSGRPDLPPIYVYASEEAHSSIDKAVMTLGLG